MPDLFISLSPLSTINNTDAALGTSQEPKEEQTDSYFSQLLTSFFPVTIPINQLDTPITTTNKADTITLPNTDNAIANSINELEENPSLTTNALNLQPADNTSLINNTIETQLTDNQTDFVSVEPKVTTIDISVTSINTTDIDATFEPQLQTTNKTNNLEKNFPLEQFLQKTPNQLTTILSANYPDEKITYQVTDEKTPTTTFREELIQPLLFDIDMGFSTFSTKKKGESISFPDLIKTLSKEKTDPIEKIFLPEETLNLLPTENLNDNNAISKTLIDLQQTDLLNDNINNKSVKTIVSINNEMLEKEKFNEKINLDNTPTNSITLDITSAKILDKPAIKRENVSVVNQISNVILTNKDEITSKSTTALEVILFPKELGRVEIKLTRNNKGDLITNIKVTTDHAYSALSNGLSHLRESLEQAGINIDQLGIQNSLHSGNQNNQTGEYNSQETNTKQLSIMNLTENANEKETASDSVSNRILSLRI